MKRPIFGRTDLRKGASEAKFDVEADFEVHLPHLPLAPPNPGENREKRNFQSKFLDEQFFLHQKMKRQESSETRFPKVAQLYGPCSRGKRPFEVRQILVVLQE